MQRKNIKGRVAVQVALIVVFHLIVVWLLKIKLEESVKLNELIIAYLGPIILLCTTCAMSLKKTSFIYNLFWIIVSALPSSCILNYFSLRDINKDRGPGIVDLSYLDIGIDYNQINLLFYFPLALSIIQIILMFGIWIITITKK
ncbi:hypothetical protein NST84_21705 [Paenibacillus sp. FSL R7-0345]|uniref:hypothetical protein n=1 Tax=Paenibacillus sp. FSL R7-0345 TaxID=2954535 RepID=UPI00315A0598